MAIFRLLAASAPAPRLSVLTYNVFCGPPTPTPLAGTLDGSARLAGQISKLRELAPDVICLQEVVSDGVRERYAHALSDMYDASFVLTADEFRCRAGRMMRLALDHVGPQTTIGGFLLGSVQSGLMILHKRATLERDGLATAFPFEDQAGDLLNRFRPRGALAVPLRLRGDGSRLLVVNTHANAESGDQLFDLSRLLSGAGISSIPCTSVHRKTQLQQLFLEASRLAGARGARALLCGDLNSSPELGTRNPLVREGWLSPGDGAATRLDYIFCGEGHWLSDHFGVMTTFEAAPFAAGEGRPAPLGCPATGRSPAATGQRLAGQRSLLEDTPFSA
ncbi:hypothetical protein EMIHUDRAFT_111736 [Emiliania huxleyi CCMP1516]|uniref:Endonuclease/exonuclease/phosphatase domain-containing protein n=2 Tax=Emiliania huxleyi TaxID=2903 RepID=A0A0D3KCW3_EMIH1|nr:hypothetical protein EMIHUDRAFT_111736 [Emiliania huxleyi CCMP1516]EOD33598.1 hypothetical protein EMIHUDRAFT_111736 [Emiliania huxleyi CCMP1516]|eukprot:XP_005786027.1 hypothetical protein EMIHUDRAFT_111736 [Emiliania huxleyi CCMP1516]